MNWRVDGERTSRVGISWVAAMTLVLAGCSSASPNVVPTPSEPIELSTPAVGAVFTCSDSYSNTTSSSSSDLKVGPLRYAGGASLADTTLSTYFDEARPTPDADGWYFLKMGAVLPAGVSVTISVDPSSGVKIVGSPDKEGTAVRYESCPDRGSAWVGGLALRGSKSSSCVSLNYQTTGGTSGRATASLFAGDCPT